MSDKKDEFEDWKVSFFTKKLMEYYKFEAHLQRSKAAMGGCLGKDVVDSGLEYTKTMIRAAVLDEMQDILYEDLFPEENDENNSKELPRTDSA